MHEWSFHTRHLRWKRSLVRAKRTLERDTEAAAAAADADADNGAESGHVIQRPQALMPLERRSKFPQSSHSPGDGQNVHKTFAFRPAGSRQKRRAQVTAFIGLLQHRLHPPPPLQPPLEGANASTSLQQQLRIKLARALVSRTSCANSLSSAAAHGAAGARARSTQQASSIRRWYAHSQTMVSPRPPQASGPGPIAPPDLLCLCLSSLACCAIDAAGLFQPLDGDQEGTEQSQLMALTAKVAAQQQPTPHEVGTQVPPWGHRHALL